MLILQYSHLHKYLFCVQFIIRYLHIFFTVMFSLKIFIVAVFTLFDLNSSADCLYDIQLYIRFQTRYSVGNNASFENVFKSVKNFSDNLQVSKTRFEKKKKMAVYAVLSIKPPTFAVQFKFTYRFRRDRSYRAILFHVRFRSKRSRTTRRPVISRIKLTAELKKKIKK